ncbi:MAG: hypothetical protein ACYC7D_10145 [Nitrososphaerales archaeon]
MIRVSSWENNDVLTKEVKSCDNHDLGEVQEARDDFLFAKKGNRLIKIPRSSVATFDGDKLYLRATEAEVYAGIYPFTDSFSESRNQTLVPRQTSTTES